MRRYDMHTHSLNSDGKFSVDDMCLAAIEKGVTGIAVTDHADMNFYESRNTPQRIGTSAAEIRSAAERYGDRLEVLCGVELGEYLYAPEKAREILTMEPYDVVLCSVHLVPAARWPMPYNRIPFDADGTDEELADYLEKYFDLLCKTVDGFDFDVLAHITCPVRYMTHRHHRKTDVMPYAEKIREILQKIIARDIALEFNTAGYQQQADVFAMYREMGGRLITLGSDAHTTAAIAGQFEETAELLRQWGFKNYYYYKNRAAYEVSL